MTILKGKVVDTRTKETIPGVRLFYSEENGNPVKDNDGKVVGTVTDGNGNFSLPFFTVPITPTVNLPIARFITAKYIGYDDYTKAIPFGEGTTINFELIPEGVTQEIEEVTVVAPSQNNAEEPVVETWFQKNKTAVAIGSVGLIALIAILIAINSKR